MPVKGTFNKNPERFNGEADYKKEIKLDELKKDYRLEMERLKRVLNNHLSTITGNPACSADNITDFVNKINELKDAFLSILKADKENERKEAEGIFSSVADRMLSFYANLNGVNYAKKMPGLKDIEKRPFLPFGAENLLKSFEDMGNDFLRLEGIYQSAGLSPENDELAKDIFDELGKIRLKNAPGKKDKDMLGLSSMGAVNIFAHFVRNIGQVISDIRGLTVDGSYPQDIEGQTLLKDLKEIIDDISNASAKRSIETESEGTLDRKAEQLCFHIKNMVDNIPLFDVEMLNAVNINGNKVSSFNMADPRMFPDYPSVNPVLPSVLEVLGKLNTIMPGYAPISSALKECTASYNKRLVDRYNELAATAFAGGDNFNETVKKMRAISVKHPVLDVQFQRDRLSLMMINKEFCISEAEHAKKVLRDIQEKGKNYINRIDTKRYNSISKGNLLAVERTVMQLADDAKETLLVAQRAQKEFRTEEAEWDKEERRLRGTSNIVRFASKNPSDPKSRQALNYYIDSFLSFSKKLPGCSYDITQSIEPKYRLSCSDDELRRITIKQYNTKAETAGIKMSDMRAEVNKGIKQNAGNLLNLYGNYTVDMADTYVTKLNSLESVFPDFNNSDLIPLMGSGSPEAEALKEEILDIQDRLSNMEPLKADDYLPLLEKCVNYLELKSPEPVTGVGKRRVEAASAVLGKIGPAIAASLGGNDADKIFNDIKGYMIRNKRFRDSMMARARECITNSCSAYTSIKDKESFVFRFNQLLAFGEVCNKGLKNKGIDIKLNNEKNKERIQYMVSKIDKAISHVYPEEIATEEEINSLFSKKTQDEMGEYLTIAQGNAALDYQKQVLSKKFFFGDLADDSGSFKVPVDNKFGFTARRGGLTALVVVHLMRDGHSLKDIFDPGKLQEERKAAAEFIYNTYNNIEVTEGLDQYITNSIRERKDPDINVLRKDNMASFLSDYLSYGLPAAVKEINNYLKTMPEITGYEIFKPENRFIIPAITVLQDLGQEVDRNYKPLIEERIGKDDLKKLISMQGGATKVLRDICNGQTRFINTLNGESIAKYGLNGNEPGIKNYVQKELPEMIAGKYAEQIIRSTCGKNDNFFEKFSMQSPEIQNITIVGMGLMSNGKLANKIASHIKVNPAESVKKLAKMVAINEVFTDKTISIDKNTFHADINNIDNIMKKNFPKKIGPGLLK